MSPNRFQANVRLWVYRYLVERDGEQCARCYADFSAAKNGSAAKNSLEIDHIDGNDWNNEPENLRLLCKNCNITLRNKSRSVDSATCERERKEGKASTRVTRQAVNYADPEAPATMQANFLYEMDFRKWLLGVIQEKGFTPKADAINAGAEVVGCSPLTASRYIAKLTSSVGCLQEVRDTLGDAMLTWKEAYQPEPTIKIDLDKLLKDSTPCPPDKTVQMF